ncbi:MULTISPECIES: galactose ABC transporter substrate-binding protein [unclassified Clostridium]|uniref:galactose ABC transporter substrate-binding protein n=1 Tax=unclassified Clostridium TaxID=2614128 RepID=UPI000297DF35|nr:MULTISPECIES: galactose ABC transporter substrate-binding protein [unclassified Clostridium]EKQ56644.1 MAG: ABC-type sugar transport system, periplasmic component [Clostridium sp. Maddingley MBC34-26]
MKVLRKRLLLKVIVITLLINILQGAARAEIKDNGNAPIRVGVFLYDLNDPFFSMIKESLMNIEKEKGNKVEFTFFDAKGNQYTQNESIDNALSSHFDALIVNLVDQELNTIQGILNKVFEKNIPLIIYADPNQELLNYVRTYKRAIFVATDTKQAGLLQGKILINLWESNKESMDKNKDNILQYIMFHGDPDSPEAIARTKDVISTLNQAGIKTQQLSLTYCDWKEECAENSMGLQFLNFGNKIEAIIANNDAMAIGAIKTLQKYGYNKGDKAKTIPVVGIDGITEAKEFIKNGFMAGTVIQDPRDKAEVFYNASINMVSGESPLANTKFKFDETGIVVRLPYYEYPGVSDTINFAK